MIDCRLETELGHLRATNILIDGYFQFSDIRNDGWPKSLARPSQPGIVLSFDTKRGRYSMPCDRYNHWEANMRAIALTLEHLRTIERYGVTTDKQEQYNGWLKLPGASAQNEALEHAKTLCQFADQDASLAEQVLKDQEVFTSTWRKAAQRTHPDSGGNALNFQLVATSRDHIRVMNGWS